MYVPTFDYLSVFYFSSQPVSTSPSTRYFCIGSGGEQATIILIATRERQASEISFDSLFFFPAQVALLCLTYIFSPCRCVYLSACPV